MFHSDDIDFTAYTSRGDWGRGGCPPICGQHNNIYRIASYKEIEHSK